MKSSVKAFAIVAVLAIVAVSCNKVEKILPKKDGLWQGTESIVTQFIDGTQDTTWTDTDSLGRMFFDKEGTGYATDFEGNNRVDFTWSVNDDNDVVTITDTSDTAVMYDVLESSKNEQKWFTSFSFDISGTTYKTDITTTMERAE
jgi:hypothetical protein